MLYFLQLPTSTATSTTVSAIVVDESAKIKETEVHSSIEPAPENHFPKRKEIDHQTMSDNEDVAPADVSVPQSVPKKRQYM